MAAGSGFEEPALGRLALMVTELATNLVRHAQDGLLLIGLYQQGEVATIELISIDRGPGIRDVEQAMMDGVSSAGTAGNGLGALKRIANQFLIFSKVGFGSVIVARLTRDNSPIRLPHGAARHAGICVAAPGEVVSGDSWASRRNGATLSVLVADGLGHGPDAADAADAAIRVFSQASYDGARDSVERAHVALRTTRGAALAVIDIDVDKRSLTFCGAGNISARIMTGIEDRSLLSQHGTVGLQVRKIQEIRYELPAHAVLVAHSDGIVTRWDLKDAPELLSCDPVILAAHLVRNKLRGRDDATAVVVHCH